MARNIREFFQEEYPSDDDGRVAAAEGDTEKEVMASAFNDQEDENDGDQTLEEMGDPIDGELADEGDQPKEEEIEASEEDDGESEEVEAEEPETEEDTRRYERDVRTVPSTRLREEADARRQAEREAAEWRARYEESQRRPQIQQPPQPQPTKPDPFADPEGHEQWLIARAEEKANERFVKLSMAQAQEDMGSAYEFVRQEIMSRQNDPQMHQTLAQIYAAPNPGRALQKWAEPLLEKYNEQREQEFQEQMSERYGVDAETFNRALAMVTKASGNRPQSQQRRMIPSLNSASGSGGTRQRLDPRGMDGSEESIFADAWTQLR